MKTGEKSSDETELKHPDIEWCRKVLIESKGEKITNDDLRTIHWNGSYYGCWWAGMFLGIETDGHIHS